MLLGKSIDHLQGGAECETTACQCQKSGSRVKAILELMGYIPLTAYTRCGNIAAWNGTCSTMRHSLPNWRRSSGKAGRQPSVKKLPRSRCCYGALAPLSDVRIATR